MRYRQHSQQPAIRRTLAALAVQALAVAAALGLLVPAASAIDVVSEPVSEPVSERSSTAVAVPEPVEAVVEEVEDTVVKEIESTVATVTGGGEQPSEPAEDPDPPAEPEPAEPEPAEPRDEPEQEKESGAAALDFDAAGPPPPVAEQPRRPAGDLTQVTAPPPPPSVPAADEPPLEPARTLPPTLVAFELNTPTPALPPSVIELGDVAAGPRSTVDILDQLAALGVGPAVAVGVLAPFPVLGKATYSDDFGAPRHIPTPHPHEGTDVFAPRGTPVVAVAGGTVDAVRTTPVSGNAVRLAGSDGTCYFYAHLDGFAPRLSVGQRVSAGALLGYVGNTGNAITTPPHVHFEVRPDCGGAVSPLPLLDGLLADARARLATLHADAGSAALTPVVAPRETSEQLAGDIDAYLAWGSPASGINAPPVPAELGPVELETTPLSAAAPLWAVIALVGAAMLANNLRRRVSPSRRGAPSPAGFITPALVKPAGAGSIALVKPAGAGPEHRRTLVAAGRR